MTIDAGSGVRVVANDGSGLSDIVGGPASFGIDGQMQTATDGGTTIAAQYNWTNSGGIAILETVISNQAMRNGVLLFN
jgi:hypothetical protein